jgi:GntR family transcriptional regulator, transcriptional repressor for pyruvate dehydrogenase complex
MAGKPRRNNGLFKEVAREPTLSDQVAATISEAIVSGKLQPEERLESERELGDRFGVSRTVIREAVRSLVAFGLIESRPGHGMLVARVGPDTVKRSVTLFLRGSASIDYQKVHEVRTAIEIEMAAAAASRASDEDIEILRSLLERLEDAPNAKEAAALDVDFHQALATATGNELFGVMLSSIGDVLVEIRVKSFNAPEMRRYAVKAHRAILKAVEAHDTEAAREAMSEHLETSSEVWALD